MFSGVYTAASGMLMNQRSLNMAANNIANVKTSGYKPKRLVKTTFDQQLVREMNGRTEGLGQGSTISVGTREMTTHGQGPIEDTGKTYDLAINGDGFFVIQGENGQYLTRNGHFTRDDEGNLMLPGVGQLMGDGGPVYVDEEGFRVGADGIIYDNEDGALDQIQIVVPDNYDNLEFYDNGTYGAGAGVELSQVYPTVYQGKLEQSGVNLNNEMTRAMEVQRAFQSCGKALTIIDQMNQKTANEIGKL